MAMMADQVARLRHSGMTLVTVMVVVLNRGIIPLQQRVHPMWEYNGVSDSTRVIRRGFHGGHAIKDMLAMMFKGEASDFLNEPRSDGFCFTKAIRPVSRDENGAETDGTGCCPRNK